jgi:ABC-type amino acid transport substrate-binding protein
MVLAMGVLSPLDATGQEGPEHPLLLGTKEAAPFAMKGPDGQWQGLSIELFARIAAAQGWEYTYRELPLEELLAEVENGALDAAVAALTITPEREAVVDFSHPFHTSGLGIAVVRDAGDGWSGAVRGLLSSGFLQVLLALVLVLLVAGALVWIFERRHNPEEFGGSLLQGLGHAFWWSAVTMTTVGYGDKSPRTVGGRIVALIWMFTSVIIISSFTAAIASSLTVGSLSTKVTGVEDLPRVRVTSVEGTTSATFLRNDGIRFRAEASLPAALDALAAGDTDAVVYDAPILRYLCRQREDAALTVLPGTFDRQDYGIALPADSPLRETLNQAILEELRRPWWQERLRHYLGD